MILDIGCGGGKTVNTLAKIATLAWQYQLARIRDLLIKDR